MAKKFAADVKPIAHPCQNFGVASRRLHGQAPFYPQLSGQYDSVQLLG